MNNRFFPGRPGRCARAEQKTGADAHARQLSSPVRRLTSRVDQRLKAKDEIFSRKAHLGELVMRMTSCAAMVLLASAVSGCAYDFVHYNPGEIFLSPGQDKTILIGIRAKSSLRNSSGGYQSSFAMVRRHGADCNTREYGEPADLGIHRIQTVHGEGLEIVPVDLRINCSKSSRNIHLIVGLKITAAKSAAINRSWPTTTIIRHSLFTDVSRLPEKDLSAKMDGIGRLFELKTVLDLDYLYVDLPVNVVSRTVAASYSCGTVVFLIALLVFFLYMASAVSRAMRGF